MSFEERRARVFKSLLLIPSRREQYMRQAKRSRKWEHLNLNKNRKYCHNSLSNFQLQRFTKKPSAFRCTGKQQHLNSAKTQIQAPNTLITSVLQEFQQQYPRFRCSVGMKHRRVQTRPGGTSGKGSTERHCKTSHTSEPEPKPQKPPQLTE